MWSIDRPDRRVTLFMRTRSFCTVPLFFPRWAQRIALLVGAGAVFGSCTDSNGPRTGTLSLTIAGLPGSVAAQVTLVGFGSFFRSSDKSGGRAGKLQSVRLSIRKSRSAGCDADETCSSTQLRISAVVPPRHEVRRILNHSPGGCGRCAFRRPQYD